MMAWFTGAPLFTGTACPVKVNTGILPAPSSVMETNDVRTSADDADVSSKSLADQVPPALALLSASDGAGIATNKSKGLPETSVLAPIIASCPKRALISAEAVCGFVSVTAPLLIIEYGDRKSVV